MNGKTARKIRKEVNKQGYEQMEFVFGMLNAMKLTTRVKYAFRLVFGKM